MDGVGRAGTSIIGAWRRGMGIASRTTASSRRISRNSSSTSSSRAHIACRSRTDGSSSPAASDLDDAPILIGEVPDEPGIAGMDVGEDPQLSRKPSPTSPLASGSAAAPGRSACRRARALAAARGRAATRASASATSCCASATAVSKNCRRSLRPARSSVKDSPPSCAIAPVSAAVTDALPQRGAGRRRRGRRESPDRFTAELPVPEHAAREPAPAVETTPRLRRYLIGVDVVGYVHEDRRANASTSAAPATTTCASSIRP